MVGRLPRMVGLFRHRSKRYDDRSSSIPAMPCTSSLECSVPPALRSHTHLDALLRFAPGEYEWVRCVLDNIHDVKSTDKERYTRSRLRDDGDAESDNDAPADGPKDRDDQAYSDDEYTTEDTSKKP